MKLKAKVPIIIIMAFIMYYLLINSSNIWVRRESANDNASDKRLDMVYTFLNRSKPIQKHDLPTFQMGNYQVFNGTCSSIPTLDIIIVVNSARNNFMKRHHIRHSYANSSLYLPARVKVLFLLAKEKPPMLNEGNVEGLLKLEYRHHKDIVKGDFVDDYHNLTLKGLMGFRFIIEHCSNARFVLKVDDDVVVNVFQLLHTIDDSSTIPDTKQSLYCNVIRHGTMPILRSGKWSVPGHLFHRQRLFPFSYCSGFFVLMPMDIIKKLYEAAKKVPFFWIDDFYLFGILPHIGRVKHRAFRKRRSLFVRSYDALRCYKERRQCNMIAAVAPSVHFHHLWKAIMSKQTRSQPLKPL